MAVRDIVAGAEMFLRTAGVADENMRRMLLQRVQEQALQKSQLDLQNQIGAQNYSNNFFDTTGKANQVGADYAPPGMTPEGMVGKPDMNQYMQGLMPYLPPSQAAATGIALSGQESREEMNRERMSQAMALLIQKLQSNQELTNAKIQGAQDLAKAKETTKEGEAPKTLSTTQGIMQWNPKTQQYELMFGPDGKPLMAPIASPDLAEEKRLSQLRAEKIMKFPKARDSLKSLETQWGSAEKFIDKAINQVSPFTAGLGSWLAVIPSTSAKDLQKNLETIGANVGFDKLQDMRANSPTGGALGQVSDLENRLLQAVQGSLAQDQSPKQLVQNLLNIKAILSQLKAQKRDAFNTDFQDINPTIQGISKEPRTPVDQTAPPISVLKEGVDRTFKNGQTWTLRNGQPVRVE